MVNTMTQSTAKAEIGPTVWVIQRPFRPTLRWPRLVTRPTCIHTPIPY